MKVDKAIPTVHDITVSDEEILAILGAADHLIGMAGRSMLAKILKGSRDKKLLALELQAATQYGFYRHLTLEQITLRIDWMIANEFLVIDYKGDMPILVFTDKGWIVQRDQAAGMLLKEWICWLEEDKPAGSADMSYLKDRNRGMILLFLEKTANSRDKRLIPYLQRWQELEYQKVRKAIGEVIHYLEQPDKQTRFRLEGAPDDDWEAALAERPQGFRLKCWDCGTRFEWTKEEQAAFRLKGWQQPKRCPLCRVKNRMQREWGFDLEL
jgi:superfamily II DNA helicase RecQ